jgi:hypothetical protein
MEKHKSHSESALAEVQTCCPIVELEVFVICL